MTTSYPELLARVAGAATAAEADAVLRELPRVQLFGVASRAGVQVCLRDPASEIRARTVRAARSR